MGSYLIQRDGTWHYSRRVPLRYIALDTRRFVRLSTGIKVEDDPKAKRARAVVEELNRNTEAYWQDLEEGRPSDWRLRYAATRSRARRMGFGYIPAAELAEGPLEQVLLRIETLLAKRLMDDPVATSALLGGEKIPNFPLSKLFQEYELISRGGLADMSADQIRKWRNPKQRALSNLIAIIGDRGIKSITRNDALEFREWWQRRILVDRLHPDTANKDFGHIQRMLTVVGRHHRLNLQSHFADLRIEGGVENTRAAFTPEFVRDRILAPGALDGINPEARAIVQIIAETGLRLSEAANLAKSTIVLDAEIPHVQIRADGRRMKTAQSRRDVPLVGVALEAAKAFPAGFPRYRDRAPSLSAAVNKYFEENNLRPTAEHSLYSLRHTFKDRLREVEAPEELIDELMGHANGKPRYGAGHGLRLKQKWLSKIAFHSSKPSG